MTARLEATRLHSSFVEYHVQVGMQEFHLFCRGAGGSTEITVVY